MAQVSAALKTDGVLLDLLALAIGSECDVEDFFFDSKGLRVEQVVVGTLAAPLMALSAFLPLMKSESLAVFYSGGGSFSPPADGWNVSYAAAKAGLHRAVESLALQLREKQIWPIAVDPSWVPSPDEIFELSGNIGGSFGLSNADLRDPDASADAVLVAFRQRSPLLSGRLVSVVRDYEADIDRIASGASPDFLHLRLCT